MMVWTATNALTNTGNRVLVGNLYAAFVTLTFDNTTVAGTLGLTYDFSAPHVTTTPGQSAALAASQGKTLMDVAGIRDILQAIDLCGSSSAGAKTATANSVAGTVKAFWNETFKGFQLFSVGNGNAGGATDPLTRQDMTELDGTAGALTGLSFRMLVLGR